jgi:hypothetical protein
MRGSLGLHFLGRVWDGLRGRHGRGHLVARLARLGQHIVARVKVLALLQTTCARQGKTQPNYYDRLVTWAVDAIYRKGGDEIRASAEKWQARRRSRAEGREKMMRYYKYPPRCTTPQGISVQHTAVLFIRFFAMSFLGGNFPYFLRNSCSWADSALAPASCRRNMHKASAWHD